MIINVGQNVEKGEPSYIIGRKVKLCSYFGKLCLFLKMVNIVTIKLRNSTKKALNCKLSRGELYDI